MLSVSLLACPCHAVKAMLKKKGDPNLVNAKGKTVLDLVQTSQSPALVKLLEGYGARRQTTTAQDRRTGRRRTQ